MRAASQNMAPSESVSSSFVKINAAGRKAAKRFGRIFQIDLTHRRCQNKVNVNILTLPEEPGKVAARSSEQCRAQSRGVDQQDSVVRRRFDRLGQSADVVSAL